MHCDAPVSWAKPCLSTLCIAFSAGLFQLKTSLLPGFEHVGCIMHRFRFLISAVIRNGPMELVQMDPRNLKQDFPWCSSSPYHVRTHACALCGHISTGILGGIIMRIMGSCLPMILELRTLCGSHLYALVGTMQLHSFLMNYSASVPLKWGHLWLRSTGVKSVPVMYWKGNITQSFLYALFRNKSYVARFVVKTVCCSLPIFICTISSNWAPFEWSSFLHHLNFGMFPSCGMTAIQLYSDMWPPSKTGSPGIINMTPDVCSCMNECWC